MIRGSPRRDGTWPAPCSDIRARTAAALYGTSRRPPLSLPATQPAMGAGDGRHPGRTRTPPPTRRSAHRRFRRAPPVWLGRLAEPQLTEGPGRVVSCLVDSSVLRGCCSGCVVDSPSWRRHWALPCRWRCPAAPPACRPLRVCRPHGERAGTRHTSTELGRADLRPLQEPDLERRHPREPRRYPHPVHISRDQTVR